MNEPMPTPIRDQRLRLGWTQEELAEKCKEAGAPVDNSQLSKIERGVSSPRPRLRAALAKLLGLDIDLQKIEVKR